MLRSAAALPSSRVAVILNGRARGVRPDVLRRLGKLLPARDLFLSRDLEHSKEIARTVLERAYDAVLLGGGDGTFVQCLSDLTGEARLHDVALPQIGVLRLGTGNALADALGASSPTAAGLARDLGDARSQRTARELPVLDVEGKLTPFAGCGLDAQILDDFATLGRFLDRACGPFGARIGANTRYALTVGLRSVPRFVFGEKPEVEVVNVGAPAFRVDWKSGRVVDEAPIAAGEVLWRGRASLASASTIPYFGLKLKMFPFADLRSDRFQLRCSTSSAFEALGHLPAVFRGEHRSPTLHDFLCQAVELRMARPIPVQIGGDLQPGARDRLRIALAPNPVRVLGRS